MPTRPPKRSTDITRQLLAFARQQTIAPKVLDLNSTIESMLKMLRRLIGEDIDLAWLPGMNGRELSEKLQGPYPDINILFMSGYTANVIAQPGHRFNPICRKWQYCQIRQMAIYPGRDPPVCDHSGPEYLTWRHFTDTAFMISDRIYLHVSGRTAERH